MAALLAWQRLFLSGASAQPTLQSWASRTEVFKLGVASGEPGPSSVVLWTRLAPEPLQPGGGMPDRPVAVRWEVAHDQRFSRIVRSGETAAQPGKAHSVHVEVAGLQSGREYFYRFIAAGQTSAVGRTRTAPSPFEQVGRLRIALASCQHYEMGAFTVHREIASADVDLVLFVGDYIYETAVNPRERRRAHAVDVEDGYTLDLYRMHHASYKLDDDLRACHAAHPWLVTWDDHDVINDYGGEYNAQGMPRERFLEVRARGYQAYFEHMPISPRRAPVGPNAAMHTHYQWGRLAEIWMLDARQFRSGPACSDLIRSPWRGRLSWGCDGIRGSDRTVLGRAQESWLSQSLARSTGAWRLLAQSTQIAPGGFHTPWQPLFYSDAWDVFPAARERLMSAIAQPRVPDVVCLGGDVHRHAAANLRLFPDQPDSPVIASEFVTSSITSRGLSELLTQWVKSSNPDLLHLRSDERGYASIDVTPQLLRCDFRATAHPVRADSRLRTQASYVVERGVPGPRKA